MAKKKNEEELIGKGYWAIDRRILDGMPDWMEDAIRRYPLTRDPSDVNIGRKLNQVTVAAICHYISLGASERSSFAAIGLFPDLYYQWRDKGEANPDSIYGEVLMLFRMAESRFTIGALETLHDASKADDRNWGAAAWLLERKHPKEWGQYRRVDQRTESNVTHNVVVYLPENGRALSEGKTIEGKARVALPDRQGAKRHGQMAEEGEDPLRNENDIAVGLASYAFDEDDDPESD